MNVAELKKMLENYPDNCLVRFELDPCGTAHTGEIHLTYASADGKKENATALTIRDVVTDEQDAKGFMEQARIGLPDEFLELCAQDNVTPEDVLHGFIADLCELMNFTNAPRADGLSSNGSDERMLANQYYERVGYAYSLTDSLTTTTKEAAP